MNKIIALQNYNNISFNRNNISKRQAQTLNKNIDSNNQYMTSEISFASRAYGLPFTNNKIIPQMSLKELLSWLESQNKVEGKDFQVDLDNSVVTVMNKSGKEEFVIYYEPGNHNSWKSYELSEYKNGELYKNVLRDEDNNISLISQIYNNNDSSIEDSFNFTYGTSPEEFLQTLKDRNVDCDIKYSGDEDKFKNITIKIYDENKEITEDYFFYYGEKNFDEQYNYASKCEYNKEGQEFRSLSFHKDKTNVTLFV